MDDTHVAARLGLGANHATWLRMLEALGPPPGGLPPVSPDALDLAGIDAADRADILATLPGNDTQAEWMWLLERAYHAARTDVGDAEGTRPMPSLPPALGMRARCFWIVVFLCAIDDIRRWHRAHGVSDEISRETLADLGRHTRLYRQRNGATGLDTHWWITLHFRGGLFSIGRLQYAPFHLLTGPAGPLFWYDEPAAAALGTGFRRGDPALGLHIPDAGPLTRAACTESFHRARRFFQAHFPEFAEAVATCTSWLLDEQLLRYLDPDSNIVAFQRRFELVPGWRESDDSTFHFVFGSTRDRIDELEPRTTLEHAIVQHVRSGGHWGMRTGWLRLGEQS